MLLFSSPCEGAVTIETITQSGSRFVEQIHLKQFSSFAQKALTQPAPSHFITAFTLSLQSGVMKMYRSIKSSHIISHLSSPSLSSFAPSASCSFSSLITSCSLLHTHILSTPFPVFFLSFYSHLPISSPRINSYSSVPASYWTSGSLLCESQHWILKAL